MAILNGHEVHHIPITLRNESLAREWYDRLTKFAHETNVGLMTDSILNVMRINPDVMEYINEVGSLNTETVMRRSRALIDGHKTTYEWEKAEAEKDDREFTKVFEPMSEDVAIKLAAKELQEAWTNFLRDNPAVGKALYFNLQGFPATLDSLKLGIECIRATVDRKRTSSDVVALIDSPNDSDFWMDASATEVAGYVDGFRAMFS